MARVKISKNFTFPKLGKEIVRNIRIPSADRNTLNNLITGTINTGQSPVSKKNSSSKGKGAFEEYSDGYARLKGKKQPVDMVLSGEMISSLRVKRIPSGIRIWFISKLAWRHDKGKVRGKKVRRLLPNRREQFTTRINTFIIKMMERAINKAVKKVNR